jgi:hypothetical protein
MQFASVQTSSVWFHPEPLCHHELLPLQGLSASNCGVKSGANRQTKHKQIWVSLHLQASHFPGLMHLPNFWVLQFQQMVIEPVHSCNRWGELAGWMPFPIVQDLSPSGSDCSPCSPAKDKAPSNNPQFSKSWWIVDVAFTQFTPNFSPRLWSLKGSLALL